MQIRSPRKLIEVALPLDDINTAAAREKSIRHGHPSTLHLWWARRPLAAARAVLFAQLVNDPGYQTGQGFTRGVNKKQAAVERERLFEIIREMVKWENTNNQDVLERARAEIERSWIETCELNKRHPDAGAIFNPAKLPAFHDPFAGGGAIPLEAQRLGLEAHASDLNPVAVMINKATVEIPSKFSGVHPIGPLTEDDQQRDLSEDWSGARGLAADVRRYGKWMSEEAHRRIGNLYPEVEITSEIAEDREDLRGLVGNQVRVIAWLWVRTVRSPNPAYSDVEVPLATTFMISTKAGKESWAEPVLANKDYSFRVGVAQKGVKPNEQLKKGTKLSRGANFECLMSKTPIEPSYIKQEGVAGRLGQKLMAVIAEGPRGRIYLSPTREMEVVAASASPTWIPDVELPEDPRNFWTLNYGLTKFGDLFTKRQLVALTTFSDLVAEARELVRADARTSGMHDDGRGLEAGGSGASAYAEAVSVYLAFAVDRCANYWSSLTPWGGEFIVQTFGRQALPMVWDFAEGNPFSDSTGNWMGAIEWIARCLETSIAAIGNGFASQRDAAHQDISVGKVVSTDPPYYDNIGYADLSDYFYIWMRRALRAQHPGIFSTLVVPKSSELVATPYRHGGKSGAESFFLSGMTEAMRRLAESAHEAFPVTIYYAFKQAETREAGTASTGWETFLEAVIAAGFLVCGTWPMRTERDQGLKTGSNVLASSIILVCRKRPADAPTASRKDFLRELKSELSEAIDAMLGGDTAISPVAPVDLAQAAIGPGMAVYSRYASVLEANGEPMSVHSALMQINKQVDEVLGGENFDPDTNFCLGWFLESGWLAGEYGKANTLAQAKATSVEGAQRAGVLEAKAGKVRLLKFSEYSPDWDPGSDNRVPVWEALHQMIGALDRGGEAEAGSLLARMPALGPEIRRLAFWLYTVCERKKWADDARGYNELVTSWHAIESASHDLGHVGAQTTLDL